MQTYNLKKATKYMKHYRQF